MERQRVSLGGTCPATRAEPLRGIGVMYDTIFLKTRSCGNFYPGGGGVAPGAGLGVILFGSFTCRAIQLTSSLRLMQFSLDPKDFYL